MVAGLVSLGWTGTAIAIDDVQRQPDGTYVRHLRADSVLRYRFDNFSASSSFGDRVQDAMRGWERITGARYPDFVHDPAQAKLVALQQTDLNNEWAAWLSMATGAGDDTRENTYDIRLTKCGGCELGFNERFEDEWYTGTGRAPSGTIDVWTVASHEIGHALGLAHSAPYARNFMHGEAAPNVMDPLDYRDRTPDKDDCAAHNFLAYGIATCNYQLGAIYSGGDGNDPRYFDFWGERSGAESVRCSKLPGVPDQCALALKAGSGQSYGSFGAIYDVDPSGYQDGDASYVQTLRAGERFRLTIQYATPSTNKASARWKACLKIRDAENSFNAQRVCTTDIRTPPDTEWRVVSTPCKTLEHTVGASSSRREEVLRSYVIVDRSALLYIGSWKVQRCDYAGGMP